MTIVVAGARGLVGSAIIRAYSRNGIEVVPLGRDQVDLRDLQATRNFLSRVKPSLVIDAAAKVGGIGANDNYPVEFLAENILIQNNLMEAAHHNKVDRFIFLGSSCIYPRDCPQPIKEEYLMTGPLEPTNSAYAIAKIAGIELINSYRKEYGYRWISLMPTNLYGPGDNFDLNGSHVLPALIRKFLEAKESAATSVSLWGTGSAIREFLHVDDLANAILKFSEEYDSADHLNIGSGDELSIRELAEMIKEIVGFSGDLIWDPTKPDGTPRKVLDSTRAKMAGWKSNISLRDGISSTISWYAETLQNGQIRV